jgi:hypothetical protein
LRRSVRGFPNSSSGLPQSFDSESGVSDHVGYQPVAIGGDDIRTAVDKLLMSREYVFRALDECQCRPLRETEWRAHPRQLPPHAAPHRGRRRYEL